MQEHPLGRQCLSGSIDELARAQAGMVWGVLGPSVQGAPWGDNWRPSSLRLGVSWCVPCRRCPGRVAGN